MSLMYNRSKDMIIDRGDLHYLPEPQKLGRFHNPYPFAEYVDDIHASLRSHAITVNHEEYVIQKDAERLFGMMVIAGTGAGDVESEGWQLTLGIRGSHDQSIPRGIAMGTKVLVCSNLCFSGELFTGKAKQTVHNAARILDMIDRAVTTIPQAAQQQRDIMSGYKYTDLAPHETDHIMIEAFKRGGLSGSQLGAAIKEFEKPSYPEHGHYGDLWKLFNAFTQAIKPSGDGIDMNTVVRKTQVITRILNERLKLNEEDS